jgi:ATP-dependent DNA helicase RecQ
MKQSVEQEAFERFGIRYLYPYQQLVIHSILEAREHRQLVILPTGAGKSLCFMLPVGRLSGITLIVYPLLSLISDQYRRFRVFPSRYSEGASHGRNAAGSSQH